MTSRTATTHKTKVLHVITRMDRGGSAQNTLLTCRGLDPNRYSIILACGLSRESRMTRAERRSVEDVLLNLRRQGVRVHWLPSLVRRIDLILDFMAFIDLRRLMIREKPEIVHTHTSKAGIIGRWAAWSAGVPQIVHTPHGHVFYGHFDPIRANIFALMERLTGTITDHFIALTRAEAEDYRRMGLCPVQRLSIIHSGVPISRFSGVRVDVAAGRKHLGISSRGPVVGTAGWLLPIKGPLVLIRAMEIVWETISEASLIYLGHGPLKSDIEREARRLGATHKVHLLGWRPSVDRILPLLDLFVMPSMNEGMGRVVVEAMASGRPVVVSRIGGLTDLVCHGETGLLVTPADAGALATAIIWMLTHPEAARRMGAAGQKRSAGYSVEAMVHQIDRLYAACGKSPTPSKQ